MKNIIPKSLQNLIQEFEKLPGIGPKTAARLAYHLLRASDKESLLLARAAGSLKQNITVCKKCYNYSETETCFICSDPSRNESQICVVEEPLDVVAIEKSNGYNGVYHVLGGAISPVNGIGPEELRMKELFMRISNDKEIEELILGTNPNLEGEATAMYVARNIVEYSKKVVVSRLARGLPIGADLEYADNVTLRKSLEGRVKF